MENVLEFIIIGVGTIIAVLAVIFFLSSQSVVHKVLELQTNKSSVFRIDNATQNYEEVSLGHEVIAQIYKDNKGILYKVVDSSNTLKITITNCMDLNELISINPTSVYDISKDYSLGKLTQITYNER